MSTPHTGRAIRLAFTDRWPLRETMIFERRYHPELAMSLADKRDVLQERNALAVWMYVPGRRRRLIGETYGVPAGYEWVVGHAKEGGSVALNRRFGAALRRRHANWYGTGEPFRFYVLKLR